MPGSVYPYERHLEEGQEDFEDNHEDGIPLDSHETFVVGRVRHRECPVIDLSQVLQWFSCHAGFLQGTNALKCLRKMNILGDYGTPPWTWQSAPFQQTLFRGGKRVVCYSYRQRWQQLLFEEEHLPVCFQSKEFCL